MAFESYMLGDEITNEGDPGARTGFAVPIRIPYYRGIVLSLIEEFELSVGDESFARADVALRLRGTDYSMDEVENDGVTRWEFGEWAHIVAKRPGGLEPGEHAVELVQQLRLSYLPWPMRAEWNKTMTVAER